MRVKRSNLEPGTTRHRRPRWREVGNLTGSGALGEVVGDWIIRGLEAGQEQRFKGEHDGKLACGGLQ